MNHLHTLFCAVAFGASASPLAAPQAAAATPKQTVIVSPSDASPMEALAARETRRYLYLRTGELLSMSSIEKAPREAALIVVGRKDRAMIKAVAAGQDAPLRILDGLAPESYYLKTIARPEGARLLVAGGDDAGTLYAAYRLAEHLGVRFYLHGDVIPDEPMDWQLPVLEEQRAPLFAVRGIQPFHDFPEGPDWWNRDDYLAVIGQLPKLGMNFIGLHTYPEGNPNAEPTVWIGLAEDVGSGGGVKSSYPASYQSTMRGNWGYAPRKTSDYLFGCAALFETDAFGADVMSGAIPAPATPEACNAVFDRTAAMLREVFTFAHQVGVKTCVGTETPLIIPKLVQERLKSGGKNPADLVTVQAVYEGIFRRAAQAYPLDYYWFWTPEGWTWSGVKEEQITATTNDLFAAIAAHRTVRPPFRLATCGWVLGPPQDRALFDKALPKEIAVSCINREVGKTPVEPGFAAVAGRSKWAIPWLEDDPGLTSPQLWAGRMRRDAADALRYGCDGLLGIHWRTRVLGPNVAALAHAAWEQHPWIDSYRPPPLPSKGQRVAGPVGGQVAAFPGNRIVGTEEPLLYQTVRYNLSAYHLPMSNGTCTVVLKFCEPHYDAPDKRVFDVKLQGQFVITNLDIFARVGQNRALDFIFTDVFVTNGWVDIDFVPRVDFPSIAAIAITGSGGARKINCGGPAYSDYAADPPGATPPPAVFAATKDFYEDWARAEFGEAVAPAAAAIFERVDCHLPVPSDWVDGPGHLKPDSRPWEQVGRNYAFVDDFAALKAKVKGAGHHERFEYWLSTFLYLRTLGEVNCAWGEYQRALERVKQPQDGAERKALARALALPAREKLVRLAAAVSDRLLATVSTPGELGTVANWQQHILPDLLLKPGEELVKLLGEALPPSALPGKEYQGATRIIVPATRSSVAAGESLKLKVIVLSQEPPRRASLFWRKLGAKRLVEIPLRHVGRGVYSIEFPPSQKEDFEYYIRVQPEKGEPCYFPPTAPRRNQTVVVMGGGGF